METPLHTIINEYGQIEQRRFRLGSGIKDKNGREIFEGNNVKCFGEDVYPVTFAEGQFLIGKYTSIKDFPRANLEVVG